MAGGALLPGYGQLAADETYDSAGRVIKKPVDPYTSAVNTQGSDYDRIMKGYQDLATQAQTPTQPISYNPSGDVTNALSMFKNFATTGGYSDNDIKAIRERAVSPIRAVYANAQRDLARNKVINGGYSPGFAGATAKMARDQAGQISSTTNAANANIAQMVQQGKLAGLSPYGSLASSEAGRGLDVSEFNTNLASQDKSRQLAALQGQQSLYGTNPALVSTFGNQALSSGAQNESARQFDLGRRDRNASNILSAAGRL